jgi:hypothetical protein
MGFLANYNAQRGHLYKFDTAGNFRAAFDFGWDSTPAVYSHDGTYSILIKDNHYDTPLYCFFSSPFCKPLPRGPYYITQLDPNLKVEWQFENTNGYEWCINAPVVDPKGVVYANSEDGNLYVIPQGHTGTFTSPVERLFLKQAIGAAYTPLSIGPDGKIYTQNDGTLFVLGQ